MATRRHIIKERSIEKVRRERASIPWPFFAASISCGLILTAGFFYAAKQHFATVHYSMRNSEMRVAKEKLEADHRKLTAERATASSDSTIEKAGLKMGLIKFSTYDFRYVDPNGNVTVAIDTKKSPTNATAKKLPAENKTQTAAGNKNLTAKTDMIQKPEKKESAGRATKNDIAKLIVRDDARTAIARK